MEEVQVTPANFVDDPMEGVEDTPPSNQVASAFSATGFPTSDLDDDTPTATEFWNAATDPNVSNKAMLEHVNGTGVNEDLFDVAGIPAADPAKYDQSVSEPKTLSTEEVSATETNGNDLSEGAAGDEFTRKPGEDEETYQKRVRALKM